MATERRAFVPRPGLVRNFALALCVWAGAAGAMAETSAELSAPSLPALRITARTFAPGEVLRVEAERSDCPATTATGTFLSGPFSLSRLSRPFARPRYAGWAAIPLDQKPGAARVSVRLECGGETPFVIVERDITILAKKFPEQRLDVESKFVNPPKAELARIDREKRLTAEIYNRRTPLPPPDAPFAKPVPGEPTSEFGSHRIFNGEPKSPHPGIDLVAAAGTPVHAAGPGKVALAQDLYFSGGTIIVDHGEGLFTVYAHLSKIETKAGATVAEGDVLGLSGATGRVTGPHLHWGARVGDTIVDPRGLLDPKLFGVR